MRTYVLMSRLAIQGPSMIEVASSMKTGPKTRRAWRTQVARQCPEVRFLASYALLGGWDFMDIYEAPDEETAAKVSMIVSGTTAFQVESWSAIAEERLQELADEVQKDVEEVQPHP